MPAPILRSRTFSSTKTPPPGIKLAPPIERATIRSFEKREDQKIWYLIQVTPQEVDFRLIHGRPLGSKTVARSCYTIARRYEDFVRFAQRLHDDFPSATRPNLPTRTSPNHPSLARAATIATIRPSADHLPKLRSRIQLLPNKQIHAQRQAEMNKFIHTLFCLPPSITQSLAVLEFFGLQKADTEQLMREQGHQSQKQQQRRRPRVTRSRSTLDLQDRRAHKHIRIHKSLSQPDLSCVKVPNRVGLVEQQQSSFSAKTMTPCSSASASPWHMLRGKPVRNSPAPTMSASTSLTSFCTQAASMIRPPWVSRAPPSVSRKPPAKKSHLSPIGMSDNPSTMSCATRGAGVGASTWSTHTPSPRLSTTTTTSTAGHPSRIKLKVIYDTDNIIVIQVPRSATLADLRSRIIKKFTDPSVHLQPEFALLYNNARSSASSSYSDSNAGNAVMITSEDQLSYAMSHLWIRLDKVALRCVFL
ncbi:hypothetical protein DFQ28_000949 [Apophysomyces sp. BC1034]|nr:hypothetical protein DFQ30_008767 [Apophysomyces sp. BC1015]KAG0183326.1 hypothetical protein DFQ29_006895 [Apophysomyces sp. BC1021]KAG0194230.1 hypothetical protein DFQ28_000949 [Apophysomyces sp. BC1034]